MPVETLQGFDHPPKIPYIPAADSSFSPEDNKDTANAIDLLFRVKTRPQIADNLFPVITLNPQRPAILSNLKPYFPSSPPDIGGRRKSDSPFIDTQVLVRPIIEQTTAISHIQPSEEIQPQAEEPADDFDIQQYLSEVNSVQRIFDRVFGRSVEILNYNPVLEIVKFRTLKTPEEKAQFPDYERGQIETALKERYSAATSIIFYEIDEDNKLRSQKLNDQPFDQILQIGIEHYKTLNSPDVPRIEKEREGFLKIQQLLTNKNTPLNTKVSVISGPGQVPGTIFKDNFVDIYQLQEDPITKKRIVKMTRFSSGKNYDQYREEAFVQKSDYFDGQDSPIDEWFLSNPILGEILTENRKALSEENMQRIIQETSPHINNLIEKVCETIINPENINDALIAVLNKADFVWEGIKSVTQKITSFVSKIKEKVIPFFENFADELYWLSQLPVRVVASGCGLSGGYSIASGIGSSISKISSSIKSFISGAISGLRGLVGNIFGKGEYYCVQCGACGEYINCEVKPGERCPIPKCNAVRECG